jgi:inner membrane transporter RhtA
MASKPGQARVGTAMAVTSVASVQFGAALAATLFPRTGPLGAVALRLVGAAVALVVVTRPWRAPWKAADLRNAVIFGVVLVAMNTSLYIAISRLPLATGITIEFLGPLSLAIATSTSGRQRAWALPAAVGVGLLGGSLRAHDVIGVIAALTAALGWASYILMSQKVGTSTHGLAGLCLANVFGALVMAPVGAIAAGAALLRPGTAALGLAVGVLSSALPYSLDLLALRRLPTAVFGVLTSLNPAMAAIAGLLVLGQHLPSRQLLGVGFVIAASAGVTLTQGAHRPNRRAPGTRPEVAPTVGPIAPDEDTQFQTPNSP